jgi:hypothetical protein
VLSKDFNPQNTKCIPPVKFFFRLELEQTKQFSNSPLEALNISLFLDSPLMDQYKAGDDAKG